jgi:hypothetical protein
MSIKRVVRCDICGDEYDWGGYIKIRDNNIRYSWLENLFFSNKYIVCADCLNRMRKEARQMKSLNNIEFVVD